MLRFLSKRALAAKENEEENTRESSGPDLFLGEKDARDIMTRRNSIVAADGSSSLRECAEEILKSSRSAVPVFSETIDTIQGILEVRDVMMKLFFHPELAETPVSEIDGIMKEAPIIPETRPVSGIFRYMMACEIRMLIVVDEYGQTSGLITLEDVLGEIAANVLRDYERDEDFVLQNTGTSVVLDGLTPLDRAEEILGCDFGTGDYETLSGYLTSRLGHIPGAGDRRIACRGFLFHILETENHTIRKVRAERLPREIRES